MQRRWLLGVLGGALVGGALGGGGRAEAQHPIVDVSVEPDDGDPGHAGLDHSILRGRLQL